MLKKLIKGTTSVECIELKLELLLNCVDFFKSRLVPMGLGCFYFVFQKSTLCLTVKDRDASLILCCTVGILASR